MMTTCAGVIPVAVFGNFFVAVIGLNGRCVVFI